MGETSQIVLLLNCFTGVYETPSSTTGNFAPYTGL